MHTQPLPEFSVMEIEHTMPSNPGSSGNPVQVYVPTKPMMADRLGNPTPLAMGGFATTLLTLSLAMMGFRGVHVQTVFIGNLCFVACIGLLISAQWEMVRGNTFAYTVLSAYALFYGGYGATLIPALGVVDAYGGFTPEYYNAVGFFVLIWGVFNIFFLVASLPLNLIYVLIFAGIQGCLTLVASSYFALAEGKVALSASLMKGGGAFGFIAGLLGYYTVAHHMFQGVFPFSIPMFDTSRFFTRTRLSEKS